MHEKDLATSAESVIPLIGTPRCPRIVDVRREAAFAEAERIIPGASWRDHSRADHWVRDLPAGPLLVYCVHGHQVSQAAASLLREAGRQAWYLAGGIEGYLAAGGPSLRKAAVPAAGEGGRWLTATPLRSEALAAAWVIRRFVDPAGRFHLAEAEWADAAASELGATGFALQPGTVADWIGELDLGLPALAQMTRIAAGQGDWAPGVIALLEGHLALEGSTDRALDRALPLFDALWVQLQDTGS